MTDWSPDTCGCTIRVSDWDNVIGQTLVNCHVHQGLVDNAHFQQVYKAENQVKNILLSHVQTNFTAALSANQGAVKAITVPQGNSVVDISAYGVAGKLSFDSNRNLVFQSSGLQPTDIINLQAYCNQTFGAGKVTVS